MTENGYALHTEGHIGLSCQKCQVFGNDGEFATWPAQLVTQGLLEEMSAAARDHDAKHTPPQGRRRDMVDDWAECTDPDDSNYLMGTAMRDQ